MYCKSPASYEQLPVTKAGLLKLPSESTLKSYMNFTESVADINPDICSIVVESKRNVSLAWDEMKIKSGVAVTHVTGKNWTADWRG